MITDNQLYSLAIFLGSAAMLLIVLYHFLEVNSEEHMEAQKPKVVAAKGRSQVNA
jgi:oligosaccharyl transferase complex subunit OST4